MLLTSRPGDENAYWDLWHVPHLQPAAPMQTLKIIIGIVLIPVAFIILANAANAPTPALSFMVGAICLILGVYLLWNQDRKTCPSCAEKVKNAANVCRYCGHRFTSTSPT
jgi:hypothetical protein